MNHMIRIIALVGGIVTGLSALAGSAYFFATGKPEAAASFLAIVTGSGIASLAFWAMGRNQGNGPLAMLIGAGMSLTGGACGAICDVYDASHAASCALCDQARGTGEECEGPACLTCDATRAPCPFEEAP